MNATTVAVDLAKNVFELAAADRSWKVIEKARLTRSQFARWFDNRAVQLVVLKHDENALTEVWGTSLRFSSVTDVVPIKR